MFFETAGIEVAPWIPPLVALVLSFFTSMGGVSGAFLLLPFQMSVLGYTSPSVSATNQFYNVVAIPSGVFQYVREGRMVWPLAWATMIGTLPGVLIGALIRVVYLPDPRNFKLFAAFVLLYLGVRIVRDLLGMSRAWRGDETAEKRFQETVGRPRPSSAAGQAVSTSGSTRVQTSRFSLSGIEYQFHGETFRASTVGLLILSFVVGIVGGVYGIGGGAIIAPFFVSFFRLPVYTVAGPALMGTCVTSVAGVIFYSIIAPFFPNSSVAPDWLLGFLFGVGGMAGMYAGARCQKYVPARYIKWLLAAIIVFTAASYIRGFLVR
jgi:uncharacterized protein